MKAQKTLRRRIAIAMFKSQCGNIDYHKCQLLAGIAIRYYAAHIRRYTIDSTSVPRKGTP